MALEGQEKLKFCASLSGRTEEENGLHTCVRLSDHGKTILADISMLESHNIVHAMSCEFFPGKKKGY